MQKIEFTGFHPCKDGPDICMLDGKEIGGRWVCGDFCKPCNIICEEIGDDEVLCLKNVPVINDYDVIPVTVGQFVRQDMYGKPIFEGDVIEYKGGTGYVKYDNNKDAFVSVEENDDYIEWLGCIEDLSVIGKRYFESNEV